MKRNFALLLLWLVAGAACGLQAQHFGIRGSFDINMPGDWHFDSNSVKMFRTGYGVQAGVVYNTPIAGNFYFEPGLTLYYDSYRYDDLVIPDSDGVTILQEDPSVRKFGVRLPLMTGYRFDIWQHASLTVFTGPELEYGISGRVSLNDAVKNSEVIDTNIYGKNGGIRRFDCSWCVGVGLPFDNDMYVGITAAFGLLDLHKGDAKFRENRVSITLGYNF